MPPAWRADNQGGKQPPGEDSGGRDFDDFDGVDGETADLDTDDMDDAIPEAMIALAVEAMTAAQRQACLAKDTHAVDRDIGHADLSKRYPKPVTVTFRDSLNKTHTPADARRGIVLLPVASHSVEGPPSDKSTGLEASKLCTHGCITQVERAPSSIVVNKAAAMHAKRELETQWKTTIATARTLRPFAALPLATRCCYVRGPTTFVTVPHMKIGESTCIRIHSMRHTYAAAGR